MIFVQLTLVISTSLISNNRYLEVKIWSLPIHENLTIDGKYCRKEEKLLLRSNFSSFTQYFQYISNFKSPITYQFVKCGKSNYFFLNSANLICRTTDISKYFRESLGIRDNESRLYFWNTLYGMNLDLYCLYTSIKKLLSPWRAAYIGITLITHQNLKIYRTQFMRK